LESHRSYVMEPEYKTAKRIYVMTGLMFLLALVQVGAAVRVLQLPPDVVDSLNLPASIQFAAGVIWALVFAAGAVSLWRRGQTALKRALWLLVVFMIYSAVRLAIFAQADYDRQRLPFVLGLAALLLTAVALNPVRQRFASGAMRSNKDGESN
jgi:FtsH-binding integral membrane protein